MPSSNVAALDARDALQARSPARGGRCARRAPPPRRPGGRARRPRRGGRRSAGSRRRPAARPRPRRAARWPRRPRRRRAGRRARARGRPAARRSPAMPPLGVGQRAAGARRRGAPPRPRAARAPPRRGRPRARRARRSARRRRAARRRARPRATGRAPGARAGPRRGRRGRRPLRRPPRAAPRARAACRARRASAWRPRPDRRRGLAAPRRAGGGARAGAATGRRRRSPRARADGGRRRGPARSRATRPAGEQLVEPGLARQRGHELEVEAGAERGRASRPRRARCRTASPVCTQHGVADRLRQRDVARRARARAPSGPASGARPAAAPPASSSTKNGTPPVRSCSVAARRGDGGCAEHLLGQQRGARARRAGRASSSVQRAVAAQVVAQAPERMRARDVVGAVGADDEQRQLVQARGQRRQELERGLVGPLQVVEQHRRRAARRRSRRAPQRIASNSVARSSVGRRSPSSGSSSARCGRSGPQPTAVRARRAGSRGERRRPGRTAHSGDREPRTKCASGAAEDLLGKARLPHARLAGQQHQGAARRRARRPAPASSQARSASRSIRSPRFIAASEFGSPGR